MTAIEHLRKLVNFGFDAGGTHFDWCRYCDKFIGVEPDPLNPHAPDCPWVAAKRWVEEQALRQSRSAVGAAAATAGIAGGLPHHHRGWHDNHCDRARGKGELERTANLLIGNQPVGHDRTVGFEGAR